ncbi:MAG: hypothetical protein LVS60_07920 [Nodosilinea sp. LVE1205-7]
MANFWNYGVAVLIVVTSGSLAYGVTRPCVVGGCDRLERSQGFHQQALTTLLSSPTAQDILTAQSNLQTALDLLTPIPVWSVHHGSAQASLERYNADLAGLRTILQAQQKAFEAAKLSQAPPHSVERWVTIHLLWQQAIDQLAPLTASSPAYDYVQKKLMVYRTNYDLIGDRIVAEETAEANFNRAIQTAQLARHKIESNDTVGDQETIKLWQRAIKELSLIPQGTLIYAQAQTQLQDYRQQLGQSVNQIKIETASTHSYDQARQAAKMATDNSAKGQWNLAARDWQQALAHLLQIPTDKTAFKNVPTLIETYQTNLRYAQNQAARNQALVGITTALGKICGSANCTVAAENDRIRINLTVPYAQELQQSLSLPRQNSANQVSPGLKQLMAAIIASSHQLNQVVLIYDGTGHFIARYRPDLGGFARDLDNDRT